jgi:hypothetical protein
MASLYEIADDPKYMEQSIFLARSSDFANTFSQQYLDIT